MNVDSQSVKLDVRWEGHLDHFQNLLSNLVINPDLADLTLVCEDKIQFNVHRIILSSSSGVFRSIIQSSSIPVIFLRGIQGQEMEDILQYIRCGYADGFDYTNLLSLFK